MRSLFKPAGQIAAVLALGLLPWLTGCEPSTGSPGEGAAQFAETLRMFVEDFARQAVAAYLF